jgi:competence protein ComGF
VSNLGERTEKHTKNVQGILSFFHKQKGFTLIETIISLAIFVMITSLIPLLLLPVQKQPPSPYLEETSLFFSMLGKEFREGRSFYIQDHVLYIVDSDSDLVSFSKYASLVRKQRNGLGHEVWLQSIRMFTPTKHSDYLLEIKIEANDGTEYNRLFRRMDN